MTTKHTPAPWTVTVPLGDKTGKHGISATGWIELATVFDNSVRGAEGEANAKLIASAPELLYELEMLVDYVRRECTVVHNLNKAEIKIIVGNAEAAIKKATE